VALHTTIAGSKVGTEERETEQFDLEVDIQDFDTDNNCNKKRGRSVISSMDVIQMVKYIKTYDDDDEEGLLASIINMHTQKEVLVAEKKAKDEVIAAIMAAKNEALALKDEVIKAKEETIREAAAWREKLQNGVENLKISDQPTQATQLEEKNTPAGTIPSAVPHDLVHTGNTSLATNIGNAANPPPLLPPSEVSVALPTVAVKLETNPPIPIPTNEASVTPPVVAVKPETLGVADILSNTRSLSIEGVGGGVLLAMVRHPNKTINTVKSLRESLKGMFMWSKKKEKNPEPPCATNQKEEKREEYRINNT